MFERIVKLLAVSTAIGIRGEQALSHNNSQLIEGGEIFSDVENTTQTSTTWGNLTRSMLPADEIDPGVQGVSCDFGTHFQFEGDARIYCQYQEARWKPQGTGVPNLFNEVVVRRGHLYNVSAVQPPLNRTTYVSMSAIPNPDPFCWEGSSPDYRFGVFVAVVVLNEMGKALALEAPAAPNFAVLANGYVAVGREKCASEHKFNDEISFVALFMMICCLMMCSGYILRDLCRRDVKKASEGEGQPYEAINTSNYDDHTRSSCCP